MGAARDIGSGSSYADFSRRGEATGEMRMGMGVNLFPCVRDYGEGEETGSGRGASFCICMRIAHVKIT